MRKNILKLFLIISIMINGLSFSIYANEDVTVFVDNAEIQFDVKPQLIGGRTMVPLRAIFEALGAVVSWDDATQTVTAYNEAYLVKAVIGQTELTVNGQSKNMDIAPMMVNNRTLVPARFVAEAFNCRVDWDADKKIVNITTTPADYNSLEQSTQSGIEYYPGTEIPTYTSVTGVELIKQDVLESGALLYMYPFTSVDDVGNYWEVLANEGWILQKSDDPKTTNTLESGWVNYNSGYIMLTNAQLDFNQLWISFKKVN